jgi:catechol 2,3-dioxygenase-like lactoylglutathione lyase family enzyme
MLLGLRTVAYAAPDLQKAREWYTHVVGHEPYFAEPFYVGFNVGGFELGLIPDGKPGPGGTTAMWGVPDIVAESKRLKDLGAKSRSEIQDVGGGIRVAEFDDPFGNVFGIIENPHYQHVTVTSPGNGK